MAILDTPSTTSATTYKPQGRTISGWWFVANCQPYTDTTSTYVVRTASTIVYMRWQHDSKD